MTPAELRAIGEKLYGQQWQTPLARAVPVASRTIRRWLAGTMPLRAVNAHRIRQLEAQFDAAYHQSPTTRKPEP